MENGKTDRQGIDAWWFIPLGGLHQQVEWKTPPTLTPWATKALYSFTACSVWRTRTSMPCFSRYSTVDGGTWREGREMNKKGERGQRRLSCPKASVLHRIRQQWSLLSHPECRHSSTGQGAPEKVSEELESQWFRVCVCVWPSSLPIPGWEKQTTVTCPKGLIPTL